LEFNSRAVDHSLTDGSAELAKYVIACVHDKGQVSLSTFGAKDQIFTFLSYHPVKQRDNMLHEGDILSFSFGIRTSYLIFWLLWDPIFPVGLLETRLLLFLVLSVWCEVIYPREFECSDQEVNTSLKSLDACQFGNSALIVEMLDPALEFLNSLSEHSGLNTLRTVPLVFPFIEITDQRRQGDEIRDLNILFFKKGVRGSDALQVTDDGRSALSEHKLEKVNRLLLEFHLVTDLRSHSLTASFSILCFGVTHEQFK
jgi:hypothetical protein